MLTSNIISLQGFSFGRVCEMMGAQSKAFTGRGRGVTDPGNRLCPGRSGPPLLPATSPAREVPEIAHEAFRVSANMAEQSTRGSSDPRASN